MPAGVANRDGCRNGVGGQIDHRDGAVAKRKSSRWRSAGKIRIAFVDDVGAAVGGVLENGDHNWVDADRYVGEYCSETNGVNRIVEIAIGIVGLRSGRAERNADDAEGTGGDAISGIGHRRFRCGPEQCQAHSGLVPTVMGFVAPGGTISRRLV